MLKHSQVLRVRCLRAASFVMSPELCGRKRMEIGLFLLLEFLVRQVIAIAGLLVLCVLILS